MTRRTGLGRHIRGDDAIGDPLDGLVNLFDIGIVLAVAFLIAGLGLTLDRSAHRLRTRTPTTQAIQGVPSRGSAPSKSGRGQTVGTIYQLPDGQLVYVKQGPR
jgi:hypothetical protein